LRHHALCGIQISRPKTPRIYPLKNLVCLYPRLPEKKGIIDAMHGGGHSLQSRGFEYPGAPVRAGDHAIEMTPTIFNPARLQVRRLQVHSVLAPESVPVTL
jgi:hypothetical protein